MNQELEKLKKLTSMMENEIAQLNVATIPGLIAFVMLAYLVGTKFKEMADKAGVMVMTLANDNELPVLLRGKVIVAFMHPNISCVRVYIPHELDENAAMSEFGRRAVQLSRELFEGGFDEKSFNFRTEEPRPRPSGFGQTFQNN
jgi:hypothetical protein